MMSAKWQDYLINAWYRDSKLVYLLLPLTVLYRVAIAVRKWLYKSGLGKVYQFDVPVIVVGNISVGGTGKSPLVAWLAELLSEQGYKPGIVSRGYAGQATHYPLVVDANTDPQFAGDEAVMLAKQTQCPVVVAPKRPQAVQQLLAQFDCDVVISDDGLQHYALGRTIEIAVLDGSRRLGNQFCLPAGPLREPAEVLNRVDFVVVNGVARESEIKMQLEPQAIYQLSDASRLLDIKDLQGREVIAVAAIGHPQRFFQTLSELGIQFSAQAFVDHHSFQASDFNVAKDAIIIMTEKDAVKCTKFADERFWVLPVRAKLEPSFNQQLLTQLSKERRHG